jgi:hypothetical protein
MGIRHASVLAHFIVDGYLAKDGSPLVNTNRVTLSDGRKVFAGSSLDGNAVK